MSDPPTCSYCLTGSTLAPQAVHICYTCNVNTTENKCCCANCAEVCHAGHEVNFLAFGFAYCDCGQSQCQLTTANTLHPPPMSPSAFVMDDSIPIFHSYTIQMNTAIDVSILQRQCQVITQLSKDTFWVDFNTPPR